MSTCEVTKTCSIVSEGNNDICLLRTHHDVKANYNKSCGRACGKGFRFSSVRPSIVVLCAIIAFIMLLPHTASADESLANPDAADTQLDVETLLGQAEPRVLELKSSRRKKCPKNFCMNNGRCRYEADLKRPICRCKGSWTGERCDEQDLFIGMDAKKFFEENSHVIIAVVLSCFGLVAVLTAFCICWRRYRFVKSHPNDTDAEVNHNILSKESNKSDDGAVTVIVDDRKHAEAFAV